MRRIISLALVSALACGIPVQVLASAGGGENAADPGDKMICKRFVKTGSLVDSYRTCKTKREWERERDERQQMSSAYSCRPIDDAAVPCK